MVRVNFHANYEKKKQQTPVFVWMQIYKKRMINENNQTFAKGVKMKLFALALASAEAREQLTLSREVQINLTQDEQGQTLELVVEPPTKKLEALKENEGNDIYYPKRLLKHLASQGMDVTKFKASVTAGGDAVRQV